MRRKVLLLSNILKMSRDQNNRIMSLSTLPWQQMSPHETAHKEEGPRHKLSKDAMHPNVSPCLEAKYGPAAASSCVTGGFVCAGGHLAERTIVNQSPPVSDETNMSPARPGSYGVTEIGIGFRILLSPICWHAGQ